MASDGSVTMVSSVHEDEYEDTDDGFDHDQHHMHHGNLSRLSVCTSPICTNDVDDNDDYRLSMALSGLSMEDGDEADGELSDYEKPGDNRPDELKVSDSDKDSVCYSFPATPPQRNRRKSRVSGSRKKRSISGAKDYASENDAQKVTIGELRRRRKMKRGNSLWVGSREGEMCCQGAESDHGSVSGGVMVITRPRGGWRALCMDMEEVKACKELGFELEHEKMVEVPAPISISNGSTLDTSSGGNSPIGNLRISSPGDDPKDVKARLKMWAQAVALASAFRHGSS